MTTWSKKSRKLKRSLVDRIVLICIVLVSVLVYSSCKTLKQANTSVSTGSTNTISTANSSTDAKLDVKTSDSSVSNTTINSTTTDKGTTSETVEEITTNTKLSPPDSTGKQYPTETTTTNRKIKRGENKNSTATAGLKSDVKANATTNDKSKLKANSTQKSKSKSKANIKETSKKTEEEKTPAWISISIVVLLLSLLFIVSQILKRFKIIK